MLITGFETDQAIIEELGLRIKQRRIDMSMTQDELAEASGVSVSTLVRIEQGTDTKLSNIIKILRALECLSGFEVLVPAPQDDFAAEFEKRPKRQRVRKSASAPHQTFIWGEDR